jgi:hypothetical protein
LLVVAAMLSMTLGLGSADVPSGYGQSSPFGHRVVSLFVCSFVRLLFNKAQEGTPRHNQQTPTAQMKMARRALI